MIMESNFVKFGTNLSKNVNLSNYSWFNLGGNAEFFYKARDKYQLKEFLKEAKNQNLRITILGAGSNTLFRDSGKGAVIKLGQDFRISSSLKEIIEVGALYLTEKFQITPKTMANLGFYLVL